MSVQPSNFLRGGINVPFSSGRSAFTSVRGALDFGSGGSGGVMSARSGGVHVRRTQQVALSVTPLAPRYVCVHARALMNMHIHILFSS